MKRYIILLNAILFFILTSFTSFQGDPTEGFKYLKQVDGIRIYYSIRAYSPEPGKAAKKVAFKLKNANKTSKTLTFKVKISDETGSATNTTMTLCLKQNEENLKKEILTQYKSIKSVEITEGKSADGGC